MQTTKRQRFSCVSFISFMEARMSGFCKVGNISILLSKEKVPIAVMNAYSSCDLDEKHEMWNEIDILRKAEPCVYLGTLMLFGERKKEWVFEGMVVCSVSIVTLFRSQFL
ncbi:hypothetical protein VNO80_20627 [Phaseolus coccineus]|uniref:Uncharacterized protein n=1 Tax=Phaseolus coccineus TaxID=3886 RepID=A0AAN9QSB2_PHACN